MPNLQKLKDWFNFNRRSTPVDDLAQSDMLCPALQREEIARLVLTAIDKYMKTDDPALVVQWNANGFLDAHGNPGRNGIIAQNVQAIIQHITDCGGVDVLNHHTVFIFPTGNALTECERTLPGW
ncbi:hypothetical protein BC936DRAFT_143573 [Jimgerdemannia flammicorona]|uniref:Uncharacterized protein n=1 Tax=Jimgerdemannia flammicorona TaxID=994334 RepID=A0A433DMH5_9FUNG|nr:hypothetical protein BC936DRAFT_143573 [Jimgerdemannia flammicorona]